MNKFYNIFVTRLGHSG